MFAVRFPQHCRSLHTLLAIAIGLAFIDGAHAGSREDAFEAESVDLFWLTGHQDFRSTDERQLSRDYQELIPIFHKQGMKHEEARVMAALRAIDPYWADVEQSLLYYWHDEDPAKAEALLTVAIERDPSRFDARYYRGLVRYHQDQLTGALADFNAARDVCTDPGSILLLECLKERGRALYDLQRYDESVQAMTEAIDAYATAWEQHKQLGLPRHHVDPHCYYERALAYANLGNAAAALADCAACEAMEVKWPNLHTLRAECYAMLDDKPREAAARRKAEELAADLKLAEQPKPFTPDTAKPLPPSK